MHKRNWVSERINRSYSHQESAWKNGVNNFVFDDYSEKYIHIKNGGKLTEFITCSYLGLAEDKRLHQSAINGIEKFGVQFAAPRTRLRTEYNDMLDAKLSAIFSAHTVLFPTVGLCHLATLPLLGAGELPSYKVPNKPLWIMDKTAHASLQILRAIMEQFGPVLRLDFNDINELKNAFALSEKQNLTPITVSDGVGSMGGCAPVSDLLMLAEKYNGYIYIDDAHGTSILGSRGSGYVMNEMNGVFNKRVIMTSSLAKAFGSNGGVVCLFSRADEEKIKKYSTPYIFGGPISIPVLCASITSADIHLSDEIYTLQKKLKDKCALFDSLSPKNTININKESPIRGLHIGSEGDAIIINKAMFNQGYACTVAMYPTVPENNAIIRVALSTRHTDEQITNFIKTFKSCMIDLNLYFDK